MSGPGYYGAMASAYDRIVSEAEYCLPTVVFNVLDGMGLASDVDILDVGIGTGLSTALFKERGSRIVGVDGSQEMLSVCASKGFADRLYQWDLTNGTLPNFEFEFDVIICLGVYEFVVRPRPFLKGIVDRLKVGGVLALAIRDLSLNPGLTEIRHGRFRIDKKAFEELGLIAVYHDWQWTRKTLRYFSMEILSSSAIFGYRSPSQGIDTMNRLAFFQKKDST
jgi:predicted TPR repeat methyltransferase